MNIIDLKANQGKVDIEVKVKSLGDTRTFNKYGKDLRVSNAIVSDDSGEITLSLWNDDIDKIKVGDTIKISNGYVSEFNGNKQLTSGKFGKMEVVGAEEAKGEVKHKDKKSKASEIEEMEF